MGKSTKFLISATLLTAVCGGHVNAATGDCDLVGGLLPVDCEYDSAGLVVRIPAGANTEFDSGTPNTGPDGFLISIDGTPVAGDKRVEDITREADKALAEADVRVTFDGLGAEPRLDVEIEDAPTRLRVGDTVRAQSRLNYPAFVVRGELLVIDRTAPGGPRTVLTVPVDPNGAAEFALPAGDTLIMVHRVYDANGRYDETAPVALNRPADRGLTDDVEEGTDFTARRRIPVNGGAVTVFGSGVARDATVRTLGTNITPDPDGSFVVQRILPSGDTVVDVQITGAGEPVYLERAVTIPDKEWFYVGTVDLTFGRRFDGGAAAAGGTFEKNFSYGRISGYAHGKTRNGWTVTASVDTTEEDLSDIFRNLDEKDPYHALRRLDEDLGYLTYGDDSTIEDGAPSRGRFYIRTEKNGSHLLWGTYKSSIDGSYYLRNERSLYGAQGVYVSPEQTTHGESKVRIEGYAAQPDRLPGRDIFVGTGGSVYFLQRQDIGLGSETVSVEVRDANTGVLIRTTALTPGRDYDINYLQGLVILSGPLSSTIGGGTVVTDASGENSVRLVVQYEYTPTVGEVDGLSYGARAEAWVSEAVRIGVTGLIEQTDVADQTAYGVDVRYRISDQSFLDVEYGRTDGLGFGSSLSADGGLIVTNTNATGGSGSAGRIAGQVDLTEIGLNTAGTLSFYGEKRTAGFSTLDYQTQNDEYLYGFLLEVRPTEQVSWRVYLDSFKDSAVAPKRDREGGIEVTYKSSERVTWDFGVEHLERENTGGTALTGSRTDAAVRVTFTESDDFKWFVFGQATVESSGNIGDNDRIGAGADIALNDTTRISGEISDGDQGLGARLLLNHQRDARTTSYVGYELLPGRELNALTLSGRDEGRFVAGGTRALSDNADVFGENTYDMFGQHRSLTSNYGVEYRPNEFLTYATSFELGRIQDPAGDFERRALSFGVRFKNDKGLSAKGRFEVRQDKGVQAGSLRDATTFLLTGTANYKIDEERRLVFTLDVADTDTDSVTVRSGEYAEVGLGYAYRPINNDKLNLLFSYRYLRDMYGQTIDGTDTLGPRQESHVLSLDASYDLDERWTIGAKIGARISSSSPNSTAAFADNNAYLAVINGRYHLTHKWDVLLEGRYLKAEQGGFDSFGVLGAAYRHLGNNFKVGLGYNFGSFSDDLTDLTYDDRGMFINLIAKF
ncbi:hypothetical protein [Pseudosulfitobacter sp. SM2401]|uniref:hypothetical protein n=1 Tax=Pseudosulfitobacter sp. SM2401 TaxID=3350098 RepID=UPI0036F2673D